MNKFQTPPRFDPTRRRALRFGASPAFTRVFHRSVISLSPDIGGENSPNGYLAPCAPEPRLDARVAAAAWSAAVLCRFRDAFRTADAYQSGGGHSKPCRRTGVHGEGRGDGVQSKFHDGDTDLSAYGLWRFHEECELSGSGDRASQFSPAIPFASDCG
jgi:hypothetical protein